MKSFLMIVYSLKIAMQPLSAHSQLASTLSPTQAFPIDGTDYFS